MAEQSLATYWLAVLVHFASLFQPCAEDEPISSVTILLQIVLFNVVEIDLAVTLLKQCFTASIRVAGQSLVFTKKDLEIYYIGYIPIVFMDIHFW